MSGGPVTSVDPFGPTADPAGYVARRASDDALQSIERALASGTSIVVFSGPPGIGKTFVLRVLEQRTAEQWTTVWLPYAALAPDELFAWTLGLLGEPAPASGAADQALLVVARDARALGQPLLLLIDDASALPRESAERVRALVHRSEGALRVVAAGLEDAAAAAGDALVPWASALGPDVARIRLVAPMNHDEVERLLRQRLEACGAPASLLARVDASLVARLLAASGGVPRDVTALASEWLRRGDAALPPGSAAGEPVPDADAPAARPVAPPDRPPGPAASEREAPASDRAPTSRDVSVPRVANQTREQEAPRTPPRVFAAPVTATPVPPREIAGRDDSLPPPATRGQATSSAPPSSPKPVATTPAQRPVERAAPAPAATTKTNDRTDRSPEPAEFARPAPIRLARIPKRIEIFFGLLLLVGAALLVPWLRGGSALRSAPVREQSETSAATDSRELENDARSASPSQQEPPPRELATPAADANGATAEVPAADVEREPLAASAANPVVAQPVEPEPPAETQAPRVAKTGPIAAAMPEPTENTPEQAAISRDAAAATPPVPSTPVAEAESSAAEPLPPPVPAAGASAAEPSAPPPLARVERAFPDAEVAPDPSPPTAVPAGARPSEPAERAPEPAPPAPAPAPVRVNINAVPWAVIEVDGVDLGETPLSGVPLVPGAHRFRARLPDGRVLERLVEISETNRHFGFE